jgi:tRNA(Ile2) C34 agmatinyltransferase TiaS
MAKKEQEDKCPKCGCTNWLGTSQGALCKNCGYIKGQPPVYPEENK